MKTTIVPAQVTTVEDKIAGRLGLSQLILLVAPVFIGASLYAILPPLIHYALYKLVIVILLFTIFSLLAIRIKGKIVLMWLIVLANYNLRPRYFVFNKNEMHLREVEEDDVVIDKDEIKVVAEVSNALVPELSAAELVKLEEVIAAPEANLRFKFNKKGGIDAFITEIK